MAAKKAVEVPALAVTSRVKEYIKAKGLRSDGDLDTAVSQMIASNLDKAAQRCKDNKRGTVRPSDL
jgi:hypothetical protein